MVSLSFVEIKSENSSEVMPTSNQVMPMLDKPTGHRFITTMNSERFSIKAADITNDLRKGIYGLNSKFTILYLYDYFNDGDSIEFIRSYGGKLHNISSANIAIITYFSPEMVRNWTNVQFREEIQYDITFKGIRVTDMVKNLKTIYGVQKLPAMVVIKKDDEEKEESFCLYVDAYNKEEKYNVFKEVMDTINDNCEENFSVIADKICGPSFAVKKSNNISAINTFNYIYDLIRDKARTVEGGYTQVDLAEELGISARGLRYKRQNNSFTRDECFYIAIRFEISIKTLNDLLIQNNQHPLGMYGRDGIIRQSLIDRWDVYETEEQLVRNGYQGIINAVDE